MSILTVLSFGGGQDSTAILERLLHDKNERAKLAPNRFIAVMSDTADEHPETYDHVIKLGRRSLRSGVPLHVVTARPDWWTTRGYPLVNAGHHLEKWPGLREFYRRTNTVGSKAFPKTCTDKLKIQPIYKFLSVWVAQQYPRLMTDAKKYRAKQPLVDLAGAEGKIRVLLGIAKGEETRAGGNDSGPRWMQLAVDKQYPLIDWGWDRQACQDYLEHLQVTVPPPSNCMLCPFMSKKELLWLYRHYRADYEDWVRIERAKLDANKHMGDRNLGVWGKKTLPEVLAEAQKEHGHMTDAELHEYKQSHGHCVRSKY
jgi:3'-phosphoadenosine 5'-phosphosulfate sulfotransferase (PAPS reductase)/FAD synthetase